MDFHGRKISGRKLSDEWPEAIQMRREAWYSLRSILVYGLVTIPIVYGIASGWSRMYFRLSDYSWQWYVASIGVMILTHDTYFYWTHRLLHQRWWYRHAHYVHHQSLSPSPWASFSFHPLESLIEALIIPALVFVLPIHVSGLLFVLTSMTIFGVINHLGYEIYPRFLVDRGIGYWFISVTHHNWHHRRFNCNYALYFRLWDIWMRTDRWPNVSAARDQRM